MIYQVKPVFFLGLFIFFFAVSLFAQTADSANYYKDSLKALLLTDTAHSVKPVDSPNVAVTAKPVFKIKNKLLNTEGKPVSLAVKLKKTTSSLE